MPQIEASPAWPAPVAPPAAEALSAARRTRIEALLKAAQGDNREKILAQLREITGFGTSPAAAAEQPAAPPAAGPKARLYAVQAQAEVASLVPARADARPEAVEALTGPTQGDLVFQRAYRQKLDDMVCTSARRHGLDPNLLKAMVTAASDYDPKRRGSGGAVGLMQLGPAAVASLGLSQPSDPAQNLEGGARLMSALKDRFGGDETRAMAAFWWDPDQVSAGAPLPGRLKGILDKVAGLRRLYTHGFSAQV